MKLNDAFVACLAGNLLLPICLDGLHVETSKA